MKGRSPILLLLVGACTQEQPVPELPQLHLVPRTQELEHIRGQGPEPPGQERMDSLRDLMETAFVPGAVSQHLAEMAKASLPQEEGAFWILEEGLEHEDPVVRSNAAYQLGQMGSHASLLPLLLRLKYEQDPAVSSWLAGALAELGNHAGLPFLSAAMRRADTAQSAGLIAIDILQRAGRDPGEEPTYDELIAGMEQLHAEWLETGVAGEVPEPDALARARFAYHLLNLMEFQLRPVDNARFVLARSGTLAVPFLHMTVNAEEDYLRIHSLEVVVQLGRIAQPLAPDILPLLGDSLCAPTAVQALGAVGAVEALPHLLAILRDGGPELRIAVAGALGPLGAPESVPILAPLVADENESMDLRVNAAFSLGLLEDGGAGRDFLEKCRDEGLYHESTLAELLDKLDQRVTLVR